MLGDTFYLLRKVVKSVFVVILAFLVIILVVFVPFFSLLVVGTRILSGNPFSWVFTVVWFGGFCYTLFHFSLFVRRKLNGAGDKSEEPTPEALEEYGNRQ
ncbi:MAG: hypothetical protein MJ176_06370 [Treponema sp.]|nr:hypothetical protein [Treponema sp.]